ncbi:hypothetical protein WBP06_03135 [Novosphingobium sp. BL-8H]|uniref:hypothetical protein n=1 Tax=Novosphingobium sp. BL-8H TaxID=3127640 RepID=UPI0037577251
MHRFTIVPVDTSYQLVEIIALDAGAVLPLIERLGCGEVHVHRDRTYIFSAQPNGTGLWSIFRQTDAVAMPAPAG